MKTIFADTFYWLASINPEDEWHDKVRSLTETLIETEIVTTEEVLTEVLNHFATTSPAIRRGSVKLIKALQDNPDIRIVPQSHSSFSVGLALYENRLHKSYSLTDCISMQTMRKLDIIEVLTHNPHFTQEGFIILFP
jgi:predicted nucleic acid-binding protein